MKRVMLTFVVAAAVAIASFGAAYACGDEAKAQPTVANAETKEGSPTAEAAAKGGCAKHAAMVAKTDGAVPAVETAEAKPCASAAGCPKKAKATQIAKDETVKPVEITDNAK